MVICKLRKILRNVYHENICLQTHQIIPKKRTTMYDPVTSILQRTSRFVTTPLLSIAIPLSLVERWQTGFSTSSWWCILKPLNGGGMSDTLPSMPYLKPIHILQLLWRQTCYRVHLDRCQNGFILNAILNVFRTSCPCFRITLLLFTYPEISIISRFG